jgi:dihydroorotate dehydrogenase (fumarate)
VTQPDLAVTYLGMELRTPLVVSSCPLTGRLDSLRRLEEHGASAVVLPSLFEEQLSFESMELDRMLENTSESFAEALSYYPDMQDYNTGPDRYLELVREAKAALSIPVVGSLNGSTPGGWVEHAALIQQAGADALELNLYMVAASPERDGAALEGAMLELVREVRQELSIPMAVKLSPHFTALAHLARRIVAAGADGLVLFNRFYQPDLDLDTLELVPRLTLSSSADLLLPLRWIGLLRGQVEASLAATSGVHTGDDALKVLLAGADAVMMASALLRSGPEHLRATEQSIREWMEEREYESVRQLQGSVAHGAAEDPSAYERVNYMKTLRSYSSRFRPL